MTEPGAVIVGAGECGAHAARALREQGCDGPVTLVGAEPHAPYERPPLSKQAITGEADAVPRTVLGGDELDALDIAFRPDTRVAAIERPDRRVTFADGDALAYRHLLLATGARPRRLPLPGAEGPRCAYLRTWDDARRLREAITPGTRVAVIGGGFIGLEIAAAARTREASVTVIEALPRLLSRVVPAEIAASVAERHARAGVEIVCGAALAAIEETGSEAVVHHAGGRLAADLVVIGIGAEPQTGLAVAAGLACPDGIAVDRYMRTSDPAVFAAGDCCRFPLDVYDGRRVRLESWRSAQEQGALAAANMAGRETPHTAIPWFWSDQYDLTLQIAGLPDEGETTVRRELADGAYILFHLKADGRLVAASGIGPGNAVARDIRVAEMLIARRSRPGIDRLTAPDFKLKKLLAA